LSKNILRVLFVLWAGSLCSTVWVALAVFRAESNPHLAGVIAAQLFSIETYLGLAVALLATLLGSRARFRWGFLAVALLLVNEWGLKPLMEQARVHGSALGLGFGPWHGVSALLYLTACAAVLVLVWKDALR
jgi:Domain of unknown function (DUF4149)